MHWSMFLGNLVMLKPSLKLILMILGGQENGGKLTIEQFTQVLTHFGHGGKDGLAGGGGIMLICRFIDRSESVRSHYYSLLFLVMEMVSFLRKTYFLRRLEFCKEALNSFGPYFVCTPKLFGIQVVN
jgi:hypothetical protein